MAIVHWKGRSLEAVFFPEGKREGHVQTIRERKNILVIRGICG